MESGSSKPTERERKKKLDRLKQLSPDELLALRAYAREQLYRFQTGKGDGTGKTPKQVRKEILSGQVPPLGVNDATFRTTPRWMRMEEIPSEQLRPGATKMVLRPEEEEQLPLDRMGYGNVFSPHKLFGKALGQRDFAWGIFAMPEAVEAALAKRWSRRKPESVLRDERFYFDVLRRCHQMDMTLMLLTSRPLPVAQAQQQLEGRLREGVGRLSGGSLAPADEADLKKFVRLFDEPRLQRRGLVEKGSVVKGTHLILSTTPAGELLAEAITPGPIRDRRGYVLGRARNPKVTGAVFEMFVGLDPLDAHGKAMVGNSLLWCANGLRFKLGDNPNQFKAVRGPDGNPRFPQPEHVEWLPQALSIFRLVEDRVEPVKHMLLGGIRRAQQQLASSTAEVATQR